MKRHKQRKETDRDVVNELMTEPSPYEFEGTLEEVRKRIGEWIEQYGRDATISWDPYRHHAYEHSPSPTYYIHKQRDETDEEWQKRLADIKAREDAQHARNLAEFERLQKLLGKKV